MEQSIGATDLRQRLTDVLQAVRERRETYVIETFGRPQAAIINLDEYRQFQRLRRDLAVQALSPQEMGDQIISLLRDALGDTTWDDIKALRGGDEDWR